MYRIFSLFKIGLCSLPPRSGISLHQQDWLQANLLLFISLLITFLAVAVVGLLLLYHSYLMLTGQTTWEQASRTSIHYLKDLPDLSNPFNEGCICNSANFLVHCRLRNWDILYHKSVKQKSWS